MVAMTEKPREELQAGFHMPTHTGVGSNLYTFAIPDRSGVIVLRVSKKLMRYWGENG